MFCKNNYGKPYLKNHPTISFNLSHSGDFVVCVFDNHPVGIDIEKIKIIEYISLAKKFFTKKEYNYIMKGDFRQQLDKFYDIWTLKESFIKCCGKGLSLPLNSFSVEIYGCNDIKLVTDSSSAKYTLQILEIDPEYKMSMCTLHTDITSNIIILNQNELINKYREIYTK
ncbi:MULTISPECIES: 4'-phosphopantetheinyl transferase superfamily protein [unclassified Bacillus (in: firmicutes)]|uniref:4'-phosphopantetheinyl transferase family protein n=1 Tax=unclassified Bacillus (in: firmicutes) TaxID=185979 RepID=UPI0008E4123E|nr:MULTISPECIES: 4'-phosphopantetheinyl transferase superfamily protein [unclassified Bacillus (in: firmicutes)]SFI31708.1 4'-phosphopantetheinyl transferase [Bacillus sp. 71mf]SFS37558.1 4'-phosphopantetheinyl transferase [Bacillus sp. 103mf]